MAKSRASRKSTRKSRRSRKSRAKACVARFSRKTRTSGYARFVKSEFKKHHKAGDKATTTMRKVAKAWRAKCG